MKKKSNHPGNTITHHLLSSLGVSTFNPGCKISLSELWTHLCFWWGC